MLSLFPDQHLNYLHYIALVISESKHFISLPSTSDPAEHRIRLSLGQNDFTSLEEDPLKASPEISAQIRFDWSPERKPTDRWFETTFLPDPKDAERIMTSSDWRAAFENTKGYSEQERSRVGAAQARLIKEWVLPAVEQAGVAARFGGGREIPDMGPRNMAKEPLTYWNTWTLFVRKNFLE